MNNGNGQNNNEQNNNLNNNGQNNNGQKDLRPFTLPELAEYNGQDGKPVYVAVNGLVYDLTSSSLWVDGQHFGNIAGRELTINYRGCHVGRPRLDNFPVIGYIVPVTQK